MYFILIKILGGDNGGETVWLRYDETLSNYVHCTLLEKI